MAAQIIHEITHRPFDAHAEPSGKLRMQEAFPDPVPHAARKYAQRT
jgi:hypothetical protein